MNFHPSTFAFVPLLVVVVWKERHGWVDGGTWVCSFRLLMRLEELLLVSLERRGVNKREKIKELLERFRGRERQ